MGAYMPFQKKHSGLVFGTNNKEYLPYLIGAFLWLYKQMLTFNKKAGSNE